MSKEKCKWLVISKGYLEKHYPREFGKLNDLLGYDWYIYQYYTIYYLVCWDCEMSFVSMKLDLNSIVDGISFWLLVSKHTK